MIKSTGLNDASSFFKESWKETEMKMSAAGEARNRMHE
jgi:hypothetical protein